MKSNRKFVFKNITAKQPKNPKKLLFTPTFNLQIMIILDLELNKVPSVQHLQLHTSM